MWLGGPPSPGARSLIRRRLLDVIAESVFEPSHESMVVWLDPALADPLDQDASDVDDRHVGGVCPAHHDGQGLVGTDSVEEHEHALGLLDQDVILRRRTEG